MLKLGIRLNAILQEIDYVDTIADIGTDHGKLVVSAVLCNRAKKAIAVDISELCLKKAQQLATSKGVERQIEFFVGDGFSPIKARVDIAIIAGMGGLEIMHIMNKDIANKYILVPHQDGYLLRKFLQDNDFFIEKDYVVKDTKFYDIIVAIKGKNNYNNTELFLGKNYPESAFYGERNLYRKNRINDIFYQHEKGNSNKELSSLFSEEMEGITNDQAKRNY